MANKRRKELRKILNVACWLFKFSRYGFEGDENKEEEEGEEEEEEEGEDMEGYLKPTFPQIERKSPR